MSWAVLTYVVRLGVAMKKVFVGLAAASVSISAYPADWAIAYSASSTDLVVFVDMASVKKAGNVVTLWVNSFPKPKFKSAGNLQNVLARMKINCAEQTYAVETYVTYTNDGETRTVPGDNNFSALIPGSNGEKRAELACDPAFPDGLGEGTLQRIGKAMTPERLAETWFAVDNKKSK